MPPQPPPSRADRARAAGAEAAREEVRALIPAQTRGAGARVKAGPVSAPVIPLLLIGFGAYFMWFGVHYWRSTAVKWPSDPVKSVLQGKGLPGAQQAPAETAQLDAVISQYSGGPGGYQGTVPPGAAQNTARLLLGKLGLGPDQMPALIRLWDQESSWNPKARNPQSGAFGIAQALGHGGADTAAPDGTNEYGAEYGLTAAEARQANAGNARWQIEWGLGYIASVYGSPDAAWAHEQAVSWY